MKIASSMHIESMLFHVKHFHKITAKQRNYEAKNEASSNDWLYIEESANVLTMCAVLLKRPINAVQLKFIYASCTNTMLKNGIYLNY